MMNLYKFDDNLYVGAAPMAAELRAFGVTAMLDVGERRAHQNEIDVVKVWNHLKVPDTRLVEETRRAADHVAAWLEQGRTVFVRGDDRAAAVAMLASEIPAPKGSLTNKVFAALARLGVDEEKAWYWDGLPYHELWPEDPVNEESPIIHRYKNHYVRDGGYEENLDHYAVDKDTWTQLQEQVREGDVIMDVGGYIGGTARALALKGGKVTTYEPHPGNVEMLRLNVAGFDVEVVPDAIAPETGERVFYIHHRSPMSHSLYPRRGRFTEIKMNTRAITEEWARLEPQVMKFDAEGIEYEMLDTLAYPPDHLKVMGIEFQLTKREWEGRVAWEWLDTLEDRGWRYTWGPVVSGVWGDLIEAVFVRR